MVQRLSVVLQVPFIWVTVWRSSSKEGREVTLCGKSRETRVKERRATCIFDRIFS
jgi:hypothetical protein